MYIILYIRTVFPYFGCEGDILQYQNRKLEPFLSEIEYESNRFFVFVFGATAPHWAMALSFTRFLRHTQRRTTLGRTPLDV